MGEEADIEGANLRRGIRVTRGTVDGWCFRVVSIVVKLREIIQTDEMDRQLRDTAALTKGYGRH